MYCCTFLWLKRLDWNFSPVLFVYKYKFVKNTVDLQSLKSEILSFYADLNSVGLHL